MKVKELIKYLETCPQDAEVLTVDNESGNCVIKEEDILFETDAMVCHGSYGTRPCETFKQAVILQ